MTNKLAHNLRILEQNIDRYQQISKSGRLSGLHFSMPGYSPGSHSSGILPDDHLHLMIILTHLNYRFLFCLVFLVQSRRIFVVTSIFLHCSAANLPDRSFVPFSFSREVRFLFSGRFLAVFFWQCYPTLATRTRTHKASAVDFFTIERATKLPCLHGADSLARQNLYLVYNLPMLFFQRKV